jgi:hypothetical protein
VTKKILVNYNFNQNEAQNLKIHNIAADPATRRTDRSGTTRQA